jgi:hypothetical protein
MALLHRTRIGASPAPTATKTATPRRAVMRRTTVQNGQAEAEANNVARQAIIDDLKLIAKNNAAIDAATASNDEAHSRIEAVLRQHPTLGGVTDGKLIAELVEAFTKESRFIDPQRFWNSVSEDDFWACISVSITEAKKVLAEKELDKIAKVTPAQSLGTKLRIKEYKTTTTRKAK